MDLDIRLSKHPRLIRSFVRKPFFLLRTQVSFSGRSSSVSHSVGIYLLEHRWGGEMKHHPSTPHEATVKASVNIVLA